MIHGACAQRVKRPVRTRMRPKEVPVVRGVVGAGGENPPATRLDKNYFIYF